MLVGCFPYFIKTEAAKQIIESRPMTGVSFDQVEITCSDEFDKISPGIRLPVFYWLKIEGRAGSDDFGTLPDGRLIISQIALDLLSKLGIANALIFTFEE